jgi:DNA helicase HerA-like ATPase
MITGHTKKGKVPRSINKDLTPFFFTSMFIGSKNSGKTYGLVKMIKNYEDKPVKDSKGNTLEIKTILFSPTGKSEANPIYTSLKSLDFENDVIENYTDNKLIEKLNEIEKDKEDIEDYNKYVKSYKIFEKNENLNLIDPEYLILLYEYDFEHYNNIPQPKYKHPPIVFIILDDLIGDNKVFKRESLINNITIKHRHLGVNLVFTSQNPRSIPNIIRNNIDIYVLYKFANVKMVLEKIYEEVSNLLTETQFEELYKHATSEPYNALVIDNHPKTERDKRFKKNFDVVLTHGA